MKSKNVIKKQQVSNFVDYVTEIYDSLQRSTVKNINLTGYLGFESFFTAIYDKFSIEELKNKYREGITRIINERLDFFNEDIQMLRKLKEISYYENSISVYTCFIIFWILDNKVELDETDIEKLCDAIFAGTVGYRLLDLNQDHNLIGSEALMLGYFLINTYEEILSEIFPASETMKTIKKYAKLYIQIEYEEKRNRWKECPFNWHEPYKLGYKASPLFSVFELLFRLRGYNKEKILSLVNGLVDVVATTQMCDDIVDADEDLSNGFETLVMSGFYKKYGVTNNIGDSTIEEFLKGERMKKFYDTNIQLFNRARKVFTENNESLILLLMELNFYQFSNSFYIES